MKSKIASMVAAACLMFSVSVAAQQPQQQGWIDLFDGSSTAAWRGYNRDTLPDGWVIDQETLYRKGRGGDIMTKAQFEDFELELEWKIAANGNSGIMYRVSEGDPAPYFSGAEFQILDNDGHRDGQNELTSAGALYGMYATDLTAVKPVGEWNKTRIVVQGKHIEHWLNGKKVVECEIDSEDWNHKLAASKFAKWKKYARNNAGHIALQDHGDPVWYRNIRIRAIASRHDQDPRGDDDHPTAGTDHGPEAGEGA